MCLSALKRSGEGKENKVLIFLLWEICSLRWTVSVLWQWKLKEYGWHWRVWGTYMFISVINFNSVQRFQLTVETRKQGFFFLFSETWQSNTQCYLLFVNTALVSGCYTSTSVPFFWTLTILLINLKYSKS